MTYIPVTYKYKGLGLYCCLVLASLGITFLFQQALLTRDMYYNSFQDQLDSTRIDEIFDAQFKYAWLGYVLMPLLLSVKIFLVTLCLQTGALLQNVKLKFSKTLVIALMAEFVFLLPLIIKLGWFVFFKSRYTLTDVQQFAPLSALSLFDAKNLSAVLIYPFQTFNVFEILYWVILAGGIKQALDADIDKGFKVVFSGYIPALILWMLCIMFLTVSLNPAA